MGEIKRDGAKAQKNSGRGHYQKGDALLSIFTVDIKEYAKSFSVSLDNWAKLCMDSRRNGETRPAFKLVLGTDHKIRLWVIGDSDMKNYIRLMEEENARASA